MNNLANSYDALGRHADALKLHEETLALRKAKLGPDHPDTLTSMQDLAWQLLRPGPARRRPRSSSRRRSRCTGQARPRPPRHAGEPVGRGQRLGAARSQHRGRRRLPAGGQGVGGVWSASMTDSRYKYNAACFRAVTAAAVRRRPTESPAGPKQAEAEAEAGRAMAWLERAVAAGYHDAAAMAADHELDALRHRADFKELLARLGGARPK